MNRRTPGRDVRLREPYIARTVRFLEIWGHGAWRLKVYGIAYRRREPSAELVDAAKRVASERLPAVTADARHYAVGFIGVHEGRGSNLVFVDWWADENELRHHVYVSTPEALGSLEYVTPTGLSACVWDLAVICFERRAWMDSVLVSAEGPDIGKYLATRFEGTI